MEEDKEARKEAAMRITSRTLLIFLVIIALDWYNGLFCLILTTGNINLGWGSLGRNNYYSRFFWLVSFGNTQKVKGVRKNGRENFRRE